MSTDLTAVRSEIPNYAGYATLEDRQMTDQQVRAYAGEILAQIPRDGLAPELATTLDELLIHCQFSDQHLIKLLADRHLSDPAVADRLGTADRAVIEAAAAARNLEPAGLAGALQSLAGAFAARDQTIESIASEG